MKIKPKWLIVAAVAVAGGLFTVLGLNKGSQAGKGLAGVAIGAAIYATSGLATAVLLNRQVRDYILANEPTRDWPVTNTGRDFPIIAREVQSALRKIAPAHRFSRAASATSS